MLIARLCDCSFRAIRYTGRGRAEETYLDTHIASGTKRVGRLLPLAALLGLALAGCEAQPPMGAAPVPPPSVATQASPMPPPPAETPAPAMASGIARFDGHYAGPLTLTLAPGGSLHCPRQFHLSGLYVENGRARLGQYRGRVRPDGRVQLAFQQNMITGRIDESGRFEGRLFRPYPGCRYSMSLQRVGPPRAG